MEKNPCAQGLHEENYKIHNAIVNLRVSSYTNQTCPAARIKHAYVYFSKFGTWARETDSVVTWNIGQGKKAGKAEKLLLYITQPKGSMCSRGRMEASQAGSWDFIYPVER